MQTTHSQAKALEYLLKMGWSLQSPLLLALFFLQLLEG